MYLIYSIKYWNIRKGNLFFPPIKKKHLLSIQKQKMNNFPTLQNHIASCEDWTHDPWFTRPVLCHWAKEALLHLWPGLKQRWESCKQRENWPCICFYCFQPRKWNNVTHHFNSDIFIRDSKIRSRQGSNLRSQRELDFKSNALTTRPRLLAASMYGHDFITASSNLN